MSNQGRLRTHRQVPCSLAVIRLRAISHELESRPLLRQRRVYRPALTKVLLRRVCDLILLKGLAYFDQPEEVVGG